MQGIGHNFSPLHERIFSDPEVSVEDVLLAVSTHLEIEKRPAIDQLSAMAVLLSSNASRVPEKLEDAHITSALDLLSHMDAHCEEVSETKAGLVGVAEELVARLKTSCKPLEEGLSPLEKILRSRITDAMTIRIDDHNGDRTDAEDPMTSLTIRSASGARATLSFAEDLEIETAGEVPREFCAPCPKLIAAAVKSGKKVPGVRQKRKPTLRITTK